MRLMTPILLAAVFMVGVANAQTSGPNSTGTTASYGTMPLSPDNCGTPDEPKPCYGTKGAKKHPRKHAPTY